MTDPIVIFNAADKDAQMQIKAFEWMAELDGQMQADCVIAQDASMNRIIAGMLLEKAGKAFAGVQHFTYERPWQVTWPHVGNWVWQTAARMVHAEIGRPWLWMEADMVPLKPGWWFALCDEYERCGKPVMGSVVPPHNHVNGTAIYPANFPEIAPNTMKARDMAWDWIMRDECLGIQHDATRLMQHAWGEVNGRLHLTEGPAPVFRSIQNVKDWISPTAVVFHRSKDGTLIDRLWEMRNQQPDNLKSPSLVGGGGGVLKL